MHNVGEQIVNNCFSDEKIMCQRIFTNKQNYLDSYMIQNAMFFYGLIFGVLTSQNVLFCMHFIDEVKNHLTHGDIS